MTRFRIRFSNRTTLKRFKKFSEHYPHKKDFDRQRESLIALIQYAVYRLDEDHKPKPKDVFVTIPEDLKNLFRERCERENLTYAQLLDLTLDAIGFQ